MLDTASRIIYCACAALCGLVLTFMWLGVLLSNDPVLYGTTRGAVLFAAGCVGWLLLWAGWWLALRKDRWLLGAVTSIASLPVAFVLALAGLLMFTTVHWQ
jgi:hypothetical protein